MTAIENFLRDDVVFILGVIVVAALLIYLGWRETRGR